LTTIKPLTLTSEDERSIGNKLERAQKEGLDNEHEKNLSREDKLAQKDATAPVSYAIERPQTHRTDITHRLSATVTSHPRAQRSTSSSRRRRRSS
jgi:hypothetical protein